MIPLVVATQNLLIKPGVKRFEMNLMEGLDMGLFSLEEIYSLELYSSKVGKSFPVPPFLADFFRDFTSYISSS